MQSDTKKKKVIVVRKLFTCTKCKKLFTKEPELEAHMKTHAEVYPFGCSYCSLTFQAVNDLKIHMKTHKNDEFECRQCSSTFSCFQKFLLHEEEHKSAEPQSLQPQLQPQPVEEIYVECDRVVITEPPLQRLPVVKRVPLRKSAAKTNDGVIVLDDDSDSSSSNDERGVRSKRTKTASDPNYNEGSNTSRRKKPTDHTCDVCKLSFSSRLLTKEHQRVHLCDLPFACHLGRCFKMFKTYKELQSHKIVHQSNVMYVDRFICDMCLEVFQSHSEFHNHKLMHHSKSFDCEFCDKKFNRQGHVLQHVRREHPDEMKFSCKLCKFLTYSKTEIDIHQIRNCEKFKCNVCEDVTFLTKQRFEAHMTLHHEKSQSFGCKVLVYD